MLRRIFLYLVGVGLGIAASIMFFGDRDIDFSYFPNARTVKHLRAQNFSISDKAMCQLTCLGLNASSFEKVFKDGDLDVDFGASDVDGMCRTYTIEVEDQSYTGFRLDDCDSLSNVLSLQVTGCTSCD
jgi:hypothetical protein|tara:strand:+ start:1059 stop:1442 length:384 start_codon:yes stop_codon:yes gene_type:complete